MLIPATCFIRIYSNKSEAAEVNEEEEAPGCHHHFKWHFIFYSFFPEVPRLGEMYGESQFPH